MILKSKHLDIWALYKFNLQSSIEYFWLRTKKENISLQSDEKCILLAGQKLLIYYKKKKHCQLFRADFTYLVMGRQLHVPHDDKLFSSLYLGESDLLSLLKT